MHLALFLLQAAAAAPPAAPDLVLPDIAINARVQARSLTIERQGDTRLTLRTAPDGGNVVDVRAPRADGRRTIRNPTVTVNAEARIADPGQNITTVAGASETSAPEPR